MAAIVLGISGSTCAGKTTMCEALKRILGPLAARVEHINQDEFYWAVDSPNHRRCSPPMNDFVNWELVSAVDNDKLLGKVRRMTGSSEGCGRSAKKMFEEAAAAAVAVEPTAGGFEKWTRDVSSRLSLANVAAEGRRPVVLILDGILLFNFRPLYDACHVRFFATLDKTTFWERRRTRTYDPPDAPGYLEHVAWPCYQRNLDELKDQRMELNYLDGSKSLQMNLIRILTETRDAL